MLTQFKSNTPTEIMLSDLSLEDKLAKILSRRFVSLAVKARCARILLEQGVDVSTRHFVLLRWAAEHGFIDIVGAILKKETDINFMNGECLLQAVNHNQRKMVEFLLEHGAELHHREFAAFRMSAALGHFTLLTMLLEHPIDVTAKNNFAIKQAFKNNHLEIVEYLIEHYENEIRAKALDNQDTTTLDILRDCSLEQESSRHHTHSLRPKA